MLDRHRQSRAESRAGLLEPGSELAQPVGVVLRRDQALVERGQRGGAPVERAQPEQLVRPGGRVDLQLGVAREGLLPQPRRGRVTQGLAAVREEHEAALLLRGERRQHELGSDGRERLRHRDLVPEPGRDRLGPDGPAACWNAQQK